MALGHVMATLVATPDAALGQVATPTLVVVGDQDNDHASGALAATLPNAQFARVPGNHFTALTRPGLATAIMAFLNDHPHEPTS